MVITFRAEHRGTGRTSMLHPACAWVLAAAVTAHFDEAVARSREITLQEMEDRPIVAKIRDALAWLVSPYL